MPKNKVVIQAGRRNLVDAEAMGQQAGYSSVYINRLADAGVIPWHGFRNGVKIYRRYNPEEVLAALAHPVKVANDDAQTVNRKVAAPPPRPRRSTKRAPVTTAAPVARDRASAAEMGI